MSLVLKKPPSLKASPSHSSTHHLKLRPISLSFPVQRFPRHPQFRVPLTILNAAIHPSIIPPKAKASNTLSLSQTLRFLKPCLVSEQKIVFLGWLCSVISVYSLSKIISLVGKVSATISDIDVIKLRDKGLVLGGLVIVRLIASYGQQAFLWKAALNAVYKLRVHAFDRVLQRELGYFEGKDGVSAGDIAYRITAEASDIADTLYALLNTIIPSTLQLSAMMTRMLVISPVLSLISALVIPCMALVVAFLGQKLRSVSRKAHLSIATLSAYLNEVLPAILFVKANNAELSESGRFKRLARIDFFECLNKKRMKAVIPQIIQAIYFGVLFILCAVSIVISRGSFSSCNLVSFVTSLLFLIEPIQDVGKAYNELRQGEPAIERLFDLIKFTDKVVEKPDAVDLDSVRGEINFCNVSFKYGEEMSLVLNGLNLHIEAGEIVALVGPSGGGKTTLIKLLLRLYDPLAGCILIDNHNIQSIRLQSLRRHVSLVSQDITLFSGTVAENIGYRDLTTEIDMERVKHAAQIANADEFVRELPEGYETNIGPRGSTLSGGQRQRLAIARALYQNSSILILDEATSALDSKSELLVRQAVKRLMKNHTVLIIAHRMETVRMAKRVFLLDRGKLEELPHSAIWVGRKDSLLSSGLVI
ncbi:ABC transporter B family member 29, chloroplastic [Prosopis cineraria]|uniref:ABC transporter B family member 29, chloroplastic n=1 Tax=Prosopis cineraria TaxID=364024 RepID=UPI0024107A30|nr:ABC transporter B family member 29, chloroplastic [Prosopis cineraria]